MAYTGNIVYDSWTHSYTLYNAKPIKFGLCPGSSDLVGMTSTGRFLALEVKSEHGRFRSGQQEFLAQVQAMGGIGIVARTLEDFRV